MAVAISPSNLTEFSAYEILDAAGHGRIGFDHRLLHTLLDNPEKNVPDILRFSVEDRATDPINLENELVAIFRYLRTPEAVPFFIEFIRRAPTDVPDELMEALFPVREAVFEPLLKLHGELEEDESGEVAFLLAALRVQDDRVLRILLDRLEYDAGDGALSLGLYGDPAARPALEKMLGELDESETHLRQDIGDAIDQLGREVDTTVPPYDIWEDFPDVSLPEFDVLTENERLAFLNSPDPEYRIGAADSFRNEELPANVRKVLFDRAQSDEDPAVRGACWRALATEGERKEIRDAMLVRLKDASAPSVERSGALLGLSSDADKPPIRQYTEQFYENPETRAAALGAMWRSLDRSFGRLFVQHLDDNDPEVKHEAIVGSGYP